VLESACFKQPVLLQAVTLVKIILYMFVLLRYTDYDYPFGIFKLVIYLNL